LSYTQADLDAIKAHIATGELSVTFDDGRQVVYRSMNDLLRAKRVIEDELAQASDLRRPRVFRVNVRKGI